MKCQLDPEGTKCIVKPDKIDEKSVGGIWIPPTAREQHQLAVTHGTLVAIGPRAEICWNNNGDGSRERTAKVGDRVVFVKYAGTNVRWGDEVYQILQDQDIIALMLEEPPPVDLVHQQVRKPLQRDRVLIPGKDF